MQPDRLGGEENAGIFERLWRQEFSAGGGMFTQVFSQRLGAALAYLGCRAGVSPNLLTILAVGTSLTGSLLFAFGAPGWGTALLCMVLYQIAYGLDCSDGQLARATGSASEFGGWLDVMADLVSLLVMAFAMLYWIVTTASSPGWSAFVGPLALAIGRVLILYSSKFTEGTGSSERPGYRGGVGKKLLWLIIDTPTFLLMSSLLREFPNELNLYLFAMGVLYCLNAVYLGFTRLARGRGE